MNALTTLLFLLSGLSGGYSLLPKQFYSTSETLPWAVAQTYCRRKYTDLAFVNSEDDLYKMREISRPTSDKMSTVWIGGFNLNSDSGNTTESNDTTYFSTKCPAIDTNSWKETKKDCSLPYTFFCSQDEGKRVLMRLKFTPDGQVNLEDPVIRAKILTKINEKFNKIGFGDVVKIRWLTMKDRRVKTNSQNNTCGLK